MKIGKMSKASSLIGMALGFLTILTGFRLLWMHWSANLAPTQDPTGWIVIFACAVYFSNALYACVMYFIGMRAKRDARLLVFSCMILLVIFATLLSEGFLDSWMPPGGALYDKAVILGLIAGGVLLFWMIRPGLPLPRSARWRHVGLALAAGLAVVAVLLPDPGRAGLVYIACLFAFVPCFLALACLFRMTVSFSKDGIWLFFGTLAAVNSFVWLVAIELLEIPFVSYPFDLLLATLCFFIYFFQKYAQALHERMHMEAALLQAQIKPHFIINTFNSIAALGRIDLDRMDDMIEELSTYIRLSIDSQNTDGLAPIERELDLVRSYLYIQEKRFGDRLKVSWEVDWEAQANIPPLTIQPLVENAISHGILKRISGGTIRIVIRKEEGGVTVAIHDNGVGMSRDAVTGLLETNGRHKRPHGGIGLRNTDRRLKQAFGEGLAIESVPGEGTTVSFRVPGRIQR